MNDGISVTGEGLEIQSSPDNFASQTNLTHTLNLNVIRIADRIPTLEITVKHMNRITGIQQRDRMMENNFFSS